MKKYKFVSVSPKVKDVVQGELVDHRNIITEHAKQGYRFITAIPTNVNAQGYPRAYDLVFEMDE